MRAVSEILAAVLLIAVALAGTISFITLSEQKIFANSITVSDALDHSTKQTSELLKKITMTNSDGSSVAYLINYGMKNITISDIILDDITDNISGDPPRYDFEFYVMSLDDKINYQNVIPLLESNSTVKLVISKPYDSQITIRSDSGNMFFLRT